MATLALFAAQSALATPGGLAPLAGAKLFAAGLVAGAIDSAFIYPTIFGKDSPEGQRLSGTEFGLAEEGAGANRLYGGVARVAGHLIWVGPLVEREDTEATGKGGSGGEFIRYKYYRHCAIEIARMKRGKTLKGISKVRADGKDFYIASGLVTDASNKISAKTRVLNVYSGPNTPTTANGLTLTSDESAGGPLLGRYQSGQTIVVGGYTSTHPLSGLMTVHEAPSGVYGGTGDTLLKVRMTGAGLLAVNDTLSFSTSGGAYVGTITQIVPTSGPDNSAEPDFLSNGTVGTPASAIVTLTPALNGNTTLGASITPTSGATANNGTFVVWSVGRSGPNTSYVHLRHETNLAYPFCSKEGSPAVGANSLTLDQEQGSFSKAQATDVRFYSGSRDQSADKTVVAVESGKLGGSSNVPAFRGLAYMVVEDLELTDFGNRVPNFEFDVMIEEDDRLSVALSEMLLDAGLSEGEFDVSGIPDSLKLGGYVVRGSQNYKTALQPIMLAFHLVSQERDGKLFIYPRTATKLIDVTGETVAFAPGDDPKRPAQFTELGDANIEQIAVVRYFNAKKNYQIGKKQAEGAVRLSKQLGEFDTNIAMSPTEAQRLANSLYEMGLVSGRRSVQFDLPPSFIGRVRESDRVRLVAFNQDRQYLVLRAEEGFDQILRCSGSEEDLEVFDQSQVVATEDA